MKAPTTTGPEPKLEMARRALDTILNESGKTAEGRLTCYVLFVDFPAETGTLVHMVSNMEDKTPVIDWAHAMVRADIKVSETRQ